MKYVLVGAVILLVLVACGALIIHFFKPRKHRLVGFREYVKNPDLKREMADYHAVRESLRVPDDISDAEIRRMVDRLFVHADDDFNFDRLELVGARAVPILVEALDKPETWKTTFPEGGHVFDPGSPFERICRLLDPFGPAEAARSLSKYAAHPQDRFRQLTALALGSIGTRECITPVRKALADEDDSVRSHAMMGILRGIDANRCEQEFLNEMFPVVTTLLNRDSHSTGGHAPRVLLAIDTKRALPVLLSPECFTPGNERVHYIIRALNESGQRIPHDVLLPFIEAVRPLVADYPHDYDYAEALKAYAINPDDMTEATLRVELSSANDKIQEYAAEGLAILSGVPDARGVAFDALDRMGFDALPAPQKYYCAIFIYDAEVRNGGHAQYFVNSSGGNWEVAIGGLVAIGATAKAGILREATSLFGSDGPSEDNDERHRQLAGLSQQQDETLETLDRKYYACEENIEALLAQYALSHREHFTRTE